MEVESCVCYANHLTPDLISLHPSFLLVSQLLLGELARPAVRNCITQGGIQGMLQAKELDHDLLSTSKGVGSRFWETEKGSSLLELRESTVSNRAFKRPPQLTETLLDKWRKVQIDDLVSELESVRTANYQLEAKIAQLEAKNKQLEDVSGSKFFCAPGPAVQGKSVLASSIPSSVPVAPLGWSPRSFPPSSLAAVAAAAACRLFWRDSQSWHLHFHAFAPFCHCTPPPTRGHRHRRPCLTLRACARRQQQKAATAAYRRNRTP